MITFVDDCIFGGRDKKGIRAQIKKLKDQKFELDEEDNLSGFLGVDIETLPDKTKRLPQTGLVDRILAAMNLTECNGRDTPAERGELGSDTEGVVADIGYNYRSIIGMMLYLEHTRTEITYAVSACSRFCNAPKVSHAMAIQRIARYLKKPKGEGLIIKPDNNLKLDLYVDASFAGLWNLEDPHDPVSIRSREN